MRTFNIPRRNKHPELDIQCAVVLWMKYQYPDVLFTASAGGARTSMAQARKLKAQGCRRGTPDLMIFEPRNGKHGLFVELKTKTGRPDDEGYQAKFILEARTRGYAAMFCYGYDEAIDSIQFYLSGTEKS